MTILSLLRYFDIYVVFVSVTASLIFSKNILESIKFFLYSLRCVSDWNPSIELYLYGNSSRPVITVDVTIWNVHLIKFDSKSADNFLLFHNHVRFFPIIISFMLVLVQILQRMMLRSIFIYSIASPIFHGVSIIISHFLCVFSIFELKT